MFSAWNGVIHVEFIANESVTLTQVLNLGLHHSVIGGIFKIGHKSLNLLMQIAFQPHHITQTPIFMLLQLNQVRKASVAIAAIMHFEIL